MAIFYSDATLRTATDIPVKVNREVYINQLNKMEAEAATNTDRLRRLFTEQPQLLWPRKQQPNGQAADLPDGYTGPPAHRPAGAAAGRGRR